ncbi:Substance-K receptor [Branchiostoma belcheri]|nr:Substance-K receptor [Branchiostoma belcheri]
MDMDNFTNESTCASENVTVEPYSVTNQFRLPEWQVALWTLPYTAIVLAAIVGNSIVIWIVFAHANMRTVTNYFLVNLAFADVSIAMSASIYTLTAICLERYIAIVHPLKPRMSRMCAKSVIAAIWLCAATVNVPLCVYSHFYTFTYGEEEWSVCRFQWPNDNVQFWYDVGLMIVNYFMPLLVMAVAYTIVGFTLWAGKIPGEATQRHVEQMKAKRRVVKMMVIVVVTFCVCWLPYHVYFLIDSSYKEWKHIQQVYLAVFWLAMSNSMYNPFIYCWLNKRDPSGARSVARLDPCGVCSAGQLSGPWRVPGGIPTGSSRVFEQAGACSAARRVPGSEVTASLRRISPNGARSVFNSELKSIRRPRGAKNRPAAVGKPAGLRPGPVRFRYGFQTALRWCPGVPSPKDPCDSSLKMNRFTKSTSTQLSTMRVVSTVHKSTSSSSRIARRVSETSVV